MRRLLAAMVLGYLTHQDGEETANPQYLPTYPVMSSSNMLTTGWTGKGVIILPMKETTIESIDIKVHRLGAWGIEIAIEITIWGLFHFLWFQPLLRRGERAADST